MDNKKDDLYYINKVIDNVNFSIEHTKDYSLEDFIRDDVLINAIMFCFIQISENANKISENFKKTTLRCWMESN